MTLPCRTCHRLALAMLGAALVPAATGHGMPSCTPIAGNPADTAAVRGLAAAGLADRTGTRRIVLTISALDNGDASPAIEAALAQARAARVATGAAATILFQPGRYRLSRPIVLSAADSGLPGAQLRFAAAPGGPVVLSGGVALQPSPLPSRLAALLPPKHRAEIASYAVPSALVPDPPFAWRMTGIRFNTPPSLFLFQSDRPIWRSAFPASGYRRENVPAPQPGPSVTPRIPLPPEAPLAAAEPALSAGGYWTFDWAYEENQLTPVTSADRAKNPGERTMPALATRYAQAPVMRYRLLNGFSFLNSPGQMAYADGAAAVFGWPGKGPVEAAAIDNLVSIVGAHDIAFEGLALEGSRADVMRISGSSGIAFRNGFVGLTGASAIQITGSHGVLVERSVIVDTGDYGVVLERAPKNPSYNVVIANNIIRRVSQLNRTYRPAIYLSGYDNAAIGNAISDLPHVAVVFSGARNRIVGNEIFRVDQETGDSGAVYAFHDISAVFNVVAQNYFHDIATPSGLIDSKDSGQIRAVYLDSWTSRTEISNNLFDTSVVPVWINGGAMNAVRRNIWFLAGGPGPVIHNIAYSRSNSLGTHVFDTPAERGLSMCANAAALYDPAFLKTGAARGNVISGNTGFRGGRPAVPVALAALQTIGRDTFPSIPSPGLGATLPRLLDAARRAGARIGPALAAADRTSALRNLRYAESAQW